MHSIRKFATRWLIAMPLILAGSASLLQGDEPSEPDNKPAETTDAAPPAAPRTLPPASAFTVVLSTEIDYDNSNAPLRPTTDVPSMAKKLYATVTTTATDFDFDLTVQIKVEEVKGKSAGEVVLTPARVEPGIIDAAAHRDLIQANFPDEGLLPGRYRLELIEAHEPGRVVTSIPFTTHLPALPPAESLAVALREARVDQEFDESLPVVTEVSSLAPALLVTVTASPSVEFDFGARLVVDDVTGLPRGVSLGEIHNPNSAPASNLTGDHPQATSTIALPAIGLPPGKYHAEIFESAPPQRVVKSVPFTSVARELNEPEFNLADAEFGGLLESVTGEDGVGVTFAPTLLMRGNTHPWAPRGAPTMNPPDPVPPEGWPCDLVISFFHREAALVSAVEILSPDGTQNMPSGLEIWTSTQSATEGFTKVGELALDQAKAINRVEFPPSSAKYVRVRLLAPADLEHAVQITGLRVLEGKAAGYQPLAQRQPDLAAWRLQPRHAAQRGLFFLQPTATIWQQGSNCLGCHVQSQSLMGIAIARRNDYVVSTAVQKFLDDYILSAQNKAGDIARNPDGRSDEPSNAESSNTIFAALGAAYSPHDTPPASEALTRVARWLAQQASDDGSLLGNDGRAPIEQGEIMFTSNCLDVWAEALKAGPDAAVQKAFDRGVAFIAQAETVTTQDKAFKIMALAKYGDAAQKKDARSLAARLQLEQTESGGWKIEPDDPAGPAAFSTGQALYAFRLAGINPNSKSFQRGVTFLLERQNADGSWKDPQLATPFAATMWPTIALAGSFGSKVEPAHVLVTALPRPPPPPVVKPAPAAAAVLPTAVAAPPKPALPKNIEFILDCSFSMYDRLGSSTRIDTAKQVMRNLVAHLPADANVGLRLYGHRYDSMSNASARDTELMIPIQPLDRAKIIAVIDAAQAHGQTPLVYSTLQAGEDIRKAGGGAIILVTDGEESCGGKPRKAGAQLAALGVPLRLDIIGFTISGKRVVEDLTAFTGATGGRYYTAADGAALSRALNDAIAPAVAKETTAAPASPPPPAPAPEPVIEDYPFEILSPSGAKIASSSSLAGDNPDLEPGDYRVVLHDGSQTVALPIKLEASQTLSLKYNPQTHALAVEN